MKTTAHLTSTNTEFERQVRKTRVGMALRSGRLEQIEEPDLGKLLRKLTTTHGEKS